MPPQQTPSSYPYGPATPEHQPEQYDFIMSSGVPRPRAPLTGASTATRAAIAGGGFVALLLVIWLFFGLLNRPTGPDTLPLLAIAQQQTEITRVAAEAEQNVASQTMRNFAAAAQLGLTTQRHAFLHFMQTYGRKTTDQVLSATKNSQTDTALQTAQTNGIYDTTYQTTATNELTAYEHALADAFSKAKDTGERQLLQQAYAEAQLLAEMVRQAL